MKTVKPQRLSLLSRTYEHRGACHFSVAAILFFDLEQPRRLLTEMSLWKAVGPELGKDAALDAALPKARAEYLVTGFAFPPGGKPAIACAPRAVVGGEAKVLHAIGERFWGDGGVATAPVPFQRMPLGWENAYGGPGFEQNPLGKGASPLPGKALRPLPNVEDPRRPIRSPRDRPPPIGFGPIDATWPQRAGKQGTYDKRWLEREFPGFPLDLDWTFFNVAPEDQWREAPFRPDEPFAFEFMHPERSRLGGQLPGAVARCFLGRKGVADGKLLELPLRLDTLWFFPHLLRGVMIFHGATPVAEDDGADVLHLVAAIEEAGKPRSVEHYQEVLEGRLDDDASASTLLREGDLVPDWPGLAAFLDPDPADPDDEEEGLLERNQDRAGEYQLAQLRAQLAAAGVEPSLVQLPNLDVGDPVGQVSIDDPEKMASQIEAAQAKVEAAIVQAESEAERQKGVLRENLRGLGLDPVKVLDAPEAGGPPKIDARAELERLREAGVSSEQAAELEERFLQLEQQVREAYRLTAHHAVAAGVPAPEAARALREALCAALAAAESLDGRDLTGADLSGLALPGARLAGAFLERANLRGANLRGADLSRVVLARADLTGADLTGARLREANLGAATLHGAALCDADLTEAVLAKADLSHADLGGANLDQADLSEATLRGARLSDVRGHELNLIQVDLSGVRLRGADLTKAVFIECTVEGADFTSAHLESVVFLKARGRGAVFRGAWMAGACCVDGCDLEQADLREAFLDGANLRGTRLAGAHFTGAHLNGADLSEADLRGAELSGIAARESRWVRTDLTGASLAGADLMAALLQKATLSGADLQRASLYQADLARVTIHERVKLDGANLKKVRVQPARER